ncbi:hypothetical protein GEMRC1_008917 [Eukaryota sp. GEM-RC1]
MPRSKLVTNSSPVRTSSSARYRHADNSEESDEAKLITKLINKYRRWIPTYICISPLDTAPELNLTDDLLTVRGNGGHRMALATHAAPNGCWYYEVRRGKGQGSIRIGWATRTSELQASCGFDQYSFGLRDSDCSLFHKGKKTSLFTGKSLKEGDVVGCLLYMSPSATSSEGVLTAEHLTSSIIGQQHAQIAYFLNGSFLCLAFADFPNDLYFPAISLYNEAEATFCFEYLAYPPTLDIPVKPLSRTFSVSHVPYYQFDKNSE